MIGDFDHPRIGVVYDPLRALVECASGDDVKTVVVDGRTVVEDGQVPGVDGRKLRDDSQRASEAYWEAYPTWDYQGKPVAERFRASLPAWDGEGA